MRTMAPLGSLGMCSLRRPAVTSPTCLQMAPQIIFRLRAPAFPRPS